MSRQEENRVLAVAERGNSRWTKIDQVSAAMQNHTNVAPRPCPSPRLQVPAMAMAAAIPTKTLISFNQKSAASMPVLRGATTPFGEAWAH